MANNAPEGALYSRPNRPPMRPRHSRAASTALSIRRASRPEAQPRRRLAISFFLFGILICALFNFVGVAAAADLVGQAAPPAVVLFAYTAPSIYVRLVVPYLPNIIPAWVSPYAFVRRILPRRVVDAFFDTEEDVEEPDEDEVLGGGESNVDYPFRMFAIAGFSFAGLQMLAWAPPIWARIVGIILVSIASNLGEMTFLQLSTLYPTNVALGAFSAGTGASGLLSAALYNILTTGLLFSTSAVIAGVGIVPISILLIYFFLLPPGSKFAGFYKQVGKQGKKEATETSKLLRNRERRRYLVINALPVRSKLYLVAGLFKHYMVPLFSTFFFIYMANQGLLPDMIFPVPIPTDFALSSLFRRIFTQLRSFYPAYQLVYMTGAFLGRTSISLFRLPSKARWMYFPALLGAIFFLSLLVETFSMVGSTDLYGLLGVLCILLFGGVSEGLAYSNSYWRVSREALPNAVENRYNELADLQAQEQPELIAKAKEAAMDPSPNASQQSDPEVLLREFLIASLAISDVFGILTASIIAAPLSELMCRYQVSHHRSLCRQR